MYLMSFEHKISIAMVLYFSLKLSGQCMILVTDNHICDGGSVRYFFIMFYTDPYRVLVKRHWYILNNKIVPIYLLKYV